MSRIDDVCGASNDCIVNPVREARFYFLHEEDSLDHQDRISLTVLDSSVTSCISFIINIWA